MTPTNEDAKNLIKRAQNILILPPQILTGDSLGTALALFYSLKKIKNNVHLFIEKIPEGLQFFNEFQPTLSKDFVISIDMAEKEVEELHYEKNEKNLKIYLRAKNGNIEEKNISFETAQKNIDSFKRELNGPPELLITIGAQGLDDLIGQSPEFIYKSPILNIDNQPSNENFGEVNLIDFTSSLSEISADLIKTIDGDLLNEDISTYLLAGIVCSSQNLQEPRTRPKTFKTASDLIEKGAKHQKIIQHLYKTKSMPRLKLLGRSLEKLSFDKENNQYLIPLSLKDFQESETGPKDLSFVLEELKRNFGIPALPAPGLLILWESHGSEVFIGGILYSSQPDLIRKILENFEGVSRGVKVLFTIKENNLDLAREKVLKILSP